MDTSAERDTYLARLWQWAWQRVKKCPSIQPSTSVELQEEWSYNRITGLSEHIGLYEIIQHFPYLIYR